MKSEIGIGTFPIIILTPENAQETRIIERYSTLTPVSLNCEFRFEVKGYEHKGHQIILSKNDSKNKIVILQNKVNNLMQSMQLISQMSDCGSYEASIIRMKEIAIDAINSIECEPKINH
jgi:glutamate mutase epsilon subunit